MTIENKSRLSVQMSELFHSFVQALLVRLNEERTIDVYQGVAGESLPTQLKELSERARQNLAEHLGCQPEMLSLDKITERVSAGPLRGPLGRARQVGNFFLIDSKEPLTTFRMVAAQSYPKTGDQDYTRQHALPIFIFRRQTTQN